MSSKSDFVCYKHFPDKYLQRYIKENAIKEKCKYCSKVRATMQISILAEYIEECMRFEFDDPYNRGAQYNSEAVYYEDRFPGVSVNDPELLLQEELEIEYEVAADLAPCFENQYLAEVDSIWGLTHDEYMRDGWKSFQRIIKHKMRFVFFDPTFNETFTNREQDELNPHKVLSEVGDAIIKLRLFRKFKKNELIVFRGIQHDSMSIHNTARTLGSPPEQIAKANRMSPAGISMFYGAFNEETCIKEIEVDVSSGKNLLTIGQFTNLRALNLIDFTKLKAIPSLFDLKNRDKRYISKFILSFIRDISVPVKPDDSVHIDYVPTQVVTEYLKYMMANNVQVDGIIYNSVKNKGNECIVLFLENQDMVDDPTFAPSVMIFDKGEYRPQLPEDFSALLLKKGTIKTIHIGKGV